MTTRLRLIFVVFSFVFLSALLSLSKGSISIPLYQLLFGLDDQFHGILFELRLPRTLTAFTSGALLALSGTLMQLLLQNPLADPYALGTSGGAALFALILMALGIHHELGIVSAAWLGSLLSMLFILCLAQKHQWQTHSLLLTGIALACGFSAGISSILLLSPATNLHNMLFWLSGDLNGARYPLIELFILGSGFIACLALAPGFNLLLRGERAAEALGLPVARYRLLLFLLSSLFTATAVTLTGCISFVGLIVPHCMRKLIGSDHRYLLPSAMLAGGGLLILADTFARTLLAPEQLPVGLFLALIGVPAFIWLIQK